MGRCTVLALSAGFAAAVSFASLVRASVYNIDISPGTGAAANLGSTTYTRDFVVGLGSPNEGTQPASSATGGEVGAGITYDDVANLLTLNYAYGHDFGFTDLTGNWTDTHIHGATSGSTVNYPSLNGSVGVIIPLAAFHTAGSSTKTGSVSTTVTLTAAQETLLFDNKLYLNVHSSFATSGEIRGQLIIVPEPAMLGTCAALSLLIIRRRKS